MRALLGLNSILQWADLSADILSSCRGHWKFAEGMIGVGGMLPIRSYPCDPLGMLRHIDYDNSIPESSYFFSSRPQFDTPLPFSTRFL